MWKYQCKKHLAIIAVAFLLGVLIVGVFGYQKAALTGIMTNTLQLPELAKTWYISYLAGGIMIAGAANGFMLCMYLIQKFNIPFIFVLIIMIVGAYSIIAPIGVITLIPAIIACIYGWMTIPNRGNHGEFSKNNVSSVAEIERVYRLHHKYIDTYEELAHKIWKYTFQINLLYAVGLIAIFAVLFTVDSLLLLIALFILYTAMMFQFARKKSIALEPIISLLYNDCNPEACASAIFALAKKSRKKKSFPLPQHLAQCMIYLNDPHLAVDVLVTCEHNKANFIFPYHSLMGYAYYQLGDESMVKHHYDECEKNSTKMGSGPLAVLKQQCLSGIQNKLDLMDKNFEEARKYFEISLPTISFEFQKVDFHYYLGLIAFIDRDFYEAKKHFEYVCDHGGEMFFVEKAKNFLVSVEAGLKQENAY